MGGGRWNLRTSTNLDVLLSLGCCLDGSDGERDESGKMSLILRYWDQDEPNSQVLGEGK